MHEQYQIIPCEDAVIRCGKRERGREGSLGKVACLCKGAVVRRLRARSGGMNGVAGVQGRRAWGYREARGGGRGSQRPFSGGSAGPAAISAVATRKNGVTRNLVRGSRVTPRPHLTPGQ